MSLLRICCLLPLSLALYAQSKDAKPVFESASIKMTAPSGGGGHSSEHDSTGLLRASMTLKSYIMAAYNVKAFQVTGGPKWIDDSTYEIVAKFEDGTAVGHDRGNQVHEALQALLADRFQLKFHHESKEMPTYVLVTTKAGFKLKPATDQGCSTNSNGNGSRVKFVATGCTMADFASALARHTGEPVTDRTAVQGKYTFTLEYTPDDLRNNASSDQPALPSLFTVIQEQLGLKLETAKAPVDIIVVDSAERPTEN